MRRTGEKIRGLERLAAMVLVATAEALCQEGQSAGGQPRQDQPAAQRRIVISIPDCKLALVEDGRVLKIYPTAVGAAASPTPAGIYTVVQRIPNPAWYGPGKVVGPGQNNPVGTRWIGLSRKSYGIHGTNRPRSIGRRASHGCIRMRNRDVEQLYEQVAVGMVVELHDRRDPALEQIFGAPQSPAAQPLPAGVPAGQ